MRTHVTIHMPVNSFAVRALSLMCTDQRMNKRANTRAQQQNTSIEVSQQSDMRQMHGQTCVSSNSRAREDTIVVVVDHQDHKNTAHFRQIQTPCGCAARNRALLARLLPSRHLECAALNRAEAQHSLGLCASLNEG